MRRESEGDRVVDYHRGNRKSILHLKHQLTLESIHGYVGFITDMISLCQCAHGLIGALSRRQGFYLVSYH